MTDDTKSFLELPAQDRRDVFESTTVRLNTPPSNVEKDYHAMQDMNLGKRPDFGWVMNQLRYTEVVIMESELNRIDARVGNSVDVGQRQK